MERFHGVRGHQDRGDEVEQGQQGVDHQLDVHPRQAVELLDDVEEVEHQQDQTEPEASHRYSVEERGPGDRVEVRHLDADEAHQVEDDHGHLHESLLGAPVRGVIAQLGRDDRLPGRRRGGRVLAREVDLGGGRHLEEGGRNEFDVIFVSLTRTAIKLREIYFLAILINQRSDS